MATGGTEIQNEKLGHDPEVVRLCELVRQTSFSIHQFFRHGHLEKTYENALLHRLTRQGTSVRPQVPLKVCDEDGTVAGNFIADLLVEEHLVIEIKACDTLSDAHTAQILGYLRASRLEHAMLINFGSPIIQFKKFILPRIH